MAKKKDKKSLIQDITNRYRVTSREARDIVTAVSTSAVSGLFGQKGSQQTKENNAAARKNILKQVGETAVAAKTGKKGTTSAKTGGKVSRSNPSPLLAGPGSSKIIYERELKPGQKRK